MRGLLQLWIVSLIICLKLYDMMTYCDIRKSEKLNLNEVYVINLDDSQARLRTVSANLIRKGIIFRRFPGVDGRKLQVFDLMNRCSNVHVEDFDWSWSFNTRVKMLVYYPKIPEAAFIADSAFGLPKMPVYGYFTPGELGCLYSHRAIWCDIVKHKYKAALILEDDAALRIGGLDIIKKSVVEIPQDADLVFVDFWDCVDCILVKREADDVLPLPGNKNIGVLKDPRKYTLGAHAYIVTIKGAKKMLTLTSKIKRCVDIIMMEGRASGKLNVYFFAPKIVKISHGSGSVISSLGRQKYEKHLFTEVN